MLHDHGFGSHKGTWFHQKLFLFWWYCIGYEGGQYETLTEKISFQMVLFEINEF